MQDHGLQVRFSSSGSCLGQSGLLILEADYLRISGKQVFVSYDQFAVSRSVPTRTDLILQTPRVSARASLVQRKPTEVYPRIPTDPSFINMHQL